MNAVLPSCAHCGSALSKEPNGRIKNGLCTRCGDAAGDKTTTAEVANVRPTDATLPPGTIVGGCILQDVLGRGGMGVVYRAKQLSLGRDVAVKILPPGHAKRGGFKERFLREAAALARINHPRIVSVIDRGEDGDHVYIVMEVVVGTSLRRAMTERRLDPSASIRIIVQLLEALAAAHAQGIVHRDIKPGNVLIDQDGDAKLADFGVALFDSVPSGPDPAFRLTAQGVALGTLTYMAPEQREGSGFLDHRADIYSVGVLLFELLTGEVPRDFVPASDVNPGIGTCFDAIIIKAMAMDPEQRFSSAEEFAAALTTAVTVQDEPSIATPTLEVPVVGDALARGLSRPTGQPIRKSRTQSVRIGVVIVALCILGFGGFFGWSWWAGHIESLAFKSLRPALEFELPRGVPSFARKSVVAPHLALLDDFDREYPDSKHRSSVADARSRLVAILGTNQEPPDEVREFERLRVILDAPRSHVARQALLDGCRRFLKEFPDSDKRGEVERWLRGAVGPKPDWKRQVRGLGPPGRKEPSLRPPR